MCTTIEDSRGMSFATEGCQVPVGVGICGETRTLDIINEFKRLYEKKMQQLDLAGGDGLQEKLKLQQEWISDLSDQNEMLVRAVEELEHEATERVRLLEDKLQRSAQCLCEVMKRYREYDVTNDLLAEPLQKVFCLENDQQNLLEFIRRIRDEKRWDVDGLQFLNINYKDIFGSSELEVDNTPESRDVEYENKFTSKEQQKNKQKDSSIKQLQFEIDRYKSLGNVECITDELKCKRTECENLRKNMADNQQALVGEIAAKHDQIMQLKRECQQLEDRCIQADKQTAFKEDIIKEMRKEIKQLKQQITQDEIIRLQCTIDDLKSNLEQMKQVRDEEETTNQGNITKLKNTIQALTSSMKELEQKYFQEKDKICKICKGRSKVAFLENAEVQTHLDDDEIKKYMEALNDKEEIIKVQSKTLEAMQTQLEALQKAEAELREEREKKCEEIQSLKEDMVELERQTQESSAKAANLQMAVDLYLNSINVLEVSEEKYKLEIEHQKSTIFNLQNALLTTKQELDELKHRSEENVSLGWAARWFGSSDSKPQNNDKKPVHDV